MDIEKREIGDTMLPDGSGFGMMTLPLPKDHWLTKEGSNVPPMPLRMGKGNPDRNKMEEMLRAAGRYAVRSATMNGKEIDFDPDALIQNLIVGFLGYHTADGLSKDDWANPSDLSFPDLIIMERERAERMEAENKKLRETLDAISVYGNVVSPTGSILMQSLFLERVWRMKPPTCSECKKYRPNWCNRFKTSTKPTDKGCKWGEKKDVQDPE